MTGKFITFEGIDGSGKSTQLRLVASALRARGVNIVMTCEPGGTPLGRSLRVAFLETEETVSPRAELLLFAADRAQHVEFLIKPSLADGRVVISDRFADATAAYQGAGRGFDPGTVKKVIELATGGLKPDLTLFFDISVETAVRRMAIRDNAEAVRNRMDTESGDFYTRVRSEYLEIAKREKKRFHIIDADRPVETVQSDVVAVVNKFLGSDV